MVIDGRPLMDGFLCEPLPVAVAADATAVLALGFDSPLPRRIDGPTRLLAQLTSAMTNHLMHARLACVVSSGRPIHSIIASLDRRVGLFDTPAMPYLVEAGRRLALEHLEAIRELLTVTSLPVGRRETSAKLHVVGT
jgi:NTE family protein